MNATSFFLSCLIIVTCHELMEVSPQQTWKCGVRARSGLTRRKRVIGGNVAKPNSWPWLINMIDKTDSLQYCSGTIIDEQWILTTAHCFIFYESGSSVATLPATKYKYVVADHRYNATDPYEYTVEPLQLFIHPQYKLADNDQPGDYDIALIKVNQTLQLSRQVKQACLPGNTKFDSSTSCYLAGWGNTVNTEVYNRSSVLREVKLKLVPFKQCNSKEVFNGTIPRRFRCAGYAQGGRDGCYGDSGAPLQCYIKGRWTVAGLMSWGSGCGAPNRYGVYTDVQQLLPSFINPVLKGSVDRLTTYHKRPLSRFKKIRKIKRKSFHQLFTKNKRFSDIDLVRNYQFTPMQITLMKSTRLLDYAFVMDTTEHYLVSKQTQTPLNKIIAGFQQNFKKFVNYHELKTFSKGKHKNVAEVIRLSGVSKEKLLNAKNPIMLIEKACHSAN